MSTSATDVPLTRFAPAPTGYLHLGHVVNALYVWGMARQRGARVLLRIEDHDGLRSHDAFEAALLDDLDWLGFEPDLYKTDDFRQGPCESRQRDRAHLYAAAFETLRAKGLAYACDCSRQDIAMAAAPNGELRYPGTCRERHVSFDEAAGWRVRLIDQLDHVDQVERFTDLLQGEQAQNPAAQCGDLLVRDRLGNWTYQFCVTVDDHLQGVDLVIRGMDLLSSTGRQIQLARMLGRLQPPVFAHHPIVMKTPLQKLSKSDRDTGVRDLRADGWTSARVISHAAGLAGLTSGVRDVRAEDAADLFSASPASY